MIEKEKREYLKRYKEAKEHGIPFFPDALFKDAVASLIIFLILVALAYFIGLPLDQRADPADANLHTPARMVFSFSFSALEILPR